MKVFFPFCGLGTSNIILGCDRGQVQEYYGDGMRSGFSGVVNQHRQGSVSSVLVLGFAFGSAKGSDLLPRLWVGVSVI